MSEHRWYAVQTTAGHENKVRSLVARKIEQDTRPAEERPIRQALVPTQEVVEIKNGKKVTVERKIFPGYVLVEMVMTQETLHTINGIQGVIKFVGHERLPQPLRPEEVNRLLGIADEVEEAGQGLVAQIRHLQPADWERRGRRSDGAEFTVRTLLQYFLHDVVHHLWDVTGQQDGAASLGWE